MRLVWVLLSILILDVLALNADAADPPRELELREALRTDAATLDPEQMRSVYEAYIYGNLFESLTRRTPSGEIVPGAAQRWTVSPDGLTWTFILQPDAKWSDGSPVTAEDFVCAWRRDLTPAFNAMRTDRTLLGLRGADALIRGESGAPLGATAKDARTLVLELVAPDDGLPARLSDESLAPVPHKRVEELGDGWAQPERFIGNGPFHLVEWIPHQQMIMDRSPTYWDRKSVAIDKVTFLMIESTDEQLKQFQRGELDITSGVPFRRLDWVRTNLPNNLTITDLNGTYFLSLNLHAAPWAADPAVRRALSLAVDREILGDQVLGGYYRPSAVLVPPSADHYHSPGPPDWPATQLGRDEEAKRLWALPGAPRPTRIKVTFVAADAGKPVSLALADMWKKTLGVDVEFDNAEFNTMLSRMTRQDLEMAMVGFMTSDPISMLGRYVSQPAIVTATSFQSPPYDALIARASLAHDPDSRAALLAQAETLLLKEAPAIPLLQMRSYHLVANRVRNFQPDHNDHAHSRDLQLAP